MNRITGDYFETLLYKIFVSIDERTSISEVDTALYCPDMFISFASVSLTFLLKIM